jgi:MFS family permease
MLITVGALVGGHLVNCVGRKRLTVVAILSAGVFTLLSYFMWNLSVFLALRWPAAFFIGITAAASSNLTLEQVPQSRGTVMSLSSAFGGVGTAVGIAVAGTVLNLFVDATIGFQTVGLTVGIFAFIGGSVIFFFAKDPVRSNV